jgi:hypothetical protein
MAANNGCDGYDGRESGRVVHVGRMRSIRIIELKVMGKWREGGASERNVVVNNDNTLKNLKTRNEGKPQYVWVGIRCPGEGTKSKHHKVQTPLVYE